MTFHRPHAAKTDKNHSQILNEFKQMVGGWRQLVDSKGVKYKAWEFVLCGIPWVIEDTSSHGGLSLDYRFRGRDGITLDIEVKTPEAYKAKDHDMTPGEKLYFETFPRHGYVITMAEELYIVIRGYCQ